MTPGSVSPVLVLGLGNTLLGDDGVGICLLEELSRNPGWGDGVEFVDGGTQGLALLGRIGNRRALVLLDALSTGTPPGTVSVSRIGSPACPGTGKTAYPTAELGARRSTTAHEGNAGELLAAAALLGDLPERVFVIGIEPECLRTSCGLSDPVRDAIPRAMEQARALIEQILRE